MCFKEVCTRVHTSFFILISYVPEKRLKAPETCVKRGKYKQGTHPRRQYGNGSEGLNARGSDA